MNVRKWSEVRGNLNENDMLGSLFRASVEAVHMPSGYEASKKEMEFSFPQLLVFVL